MANPGPFKVERGLADTREDLAGWEPCGAAPVGRLTLMRTRLLIALLILNLIVSSVALGGLVRGAFPLRANGPNSLRDELNEIRGQSLRDELRNR